MDLKMSRKYESKAGGKRNTYCFQLGRHVASNPEVEGLFRG